MVPIISFIGWHNSGKTTIIQEVVRHLKQENLRVAVIKSTQQTGIEFDRPGTDTDAYRKAGADAVTFIAPDQFVLMTSRDDDVDERNLLSVVHRYFHRYDIVLAEGFKHVRTIPKIAVIREGAEPLGENVYRVIATVSDGQKAGDLVFRPDETRRIAEFIMNKFLVEENKYEETVLLFVNGRKVPMKRFVQDALAGTVYGFVHSLKQTGDIADIELIIQVDRDEVHR